MLSAKAVAVAAAASCAAAYLQANGVPAFVQGWFVTRAAAEAQLHQLYRPVDNLLLRAVGYAALALVGYAWFFWVVTALAAAWQRYRYVPVGTTTRPPPVPGIQGGGAGGQQQQPQTPAAAAAPTVPAASQQQQQQRVAPCAAAAAAVAARTPPPPTPQPQQPLPVPERQQAAAGGDPHDAARRRALEAAQRALDAQAAALKAQRDQQDAERRARLAATAAAAEAAAAAAARQAPPPVAAAAPAAQASSAAAAAAAAAADQGRDSLATARQLRDEQDWEFQQSLAADRARSEQRSAAAKEQQRRAREQQHLTALRQRLQAELPPEPQDGQDGSGVSIRVRLPDGSHASRRFARADAFCRVHDWVFSLPAMPLLRPGSWSLASSWPRQRLAPAPAGDGSSSSRDSIWIADGWAREVAVQQQREAQAAAQLAPGEWLLEVRQAAGKQLAVRVSSTTSIADVKQALREQTGLAPIEQRLIFSGRVLTSGSSLGQLGIGPGHVLQLAPRTSSSSSAEGDSKSRSEGASGGGGGAESSDALALATVGELADHVGSSQMVLLVKQ